MPSIERRKTRSDVPAEAVRLYLELHAARAGVRAAALSDDSGVLIGGVGDVDLDVLAAVGPLFVTGSSDALGRATEELVDSVVQNHDLYVTKIAVQGKTLVLTSLGARLPEQRRAERAFERIFTPKSH